MALFLGLDCGGSSTRALVLDEDGTVQFEGSAGPANMASTPADEIVHNLANALRDCPPVDACVGCFAGLLTNADRHRAIGHLESVIQADRYDARADYEAALAAEPDADVLIIAGTGSVVVSRNGEKSVRTAGGGPLIGDPGSAFDIGRRAVFHTLASAERLEPGPIFLAELASLFGSVETNDVLAAVYRSVSPASRLASLAPAVCLEWHRGLPYATLSVREALSSLVAEFRAHIDRYLADKQELSVVLAGGLWDADPMVEEQFNALFSTTASSPDSPRPVIHTRRPAHRPVEGSVRLAKELQ